MTQPGSGGLWAILPVKSFSRAKTRLSPVLGATAREALARSMFEHVLGVASASPVVARVLVATDGDEVAEIARARGAAVVFDPPGCRLGLVVDAALAHAAAQGAASALVLMSDLPRLSPADVAALAGLLERHEVVLGPDRAREGTNALGLSPPDLLPTCFGTADSFSRHEARAKEAGARVAVLESPDLGLDVDLPADFARLQKLGAPREAAAPRRRALGG